ncbi:MAG: SPOR domain-containing protein [Bacteroidales bacterium]
MKFEQFIVEKLFEGEEIRLEDLGKFQPVDKPTSIHPGNHEFAPSGRTVAFEFNPHEKDKGFAEFIAAKTNQTKKEILAEIKKWVADIKEQLSNGKKVQLKNIGFLVFDFQGDVILEVDESMNFSKQSYGLPRFQQEVIPGKEPKVSQNKTNHSTDKETNIKKDKRNIPQKEPAKKANNKKKRAWAIPAILLIFIAAAGWYVQSEWQIISDMQIPREKAPKNTSEKKTVNRKDQNQETIKESNPDKEASKTKHSLKDSNTENGNLKQEAQTKPTNNQNKKTPAEKTQKTTKAQAGDYLIIAGCFKSYENAEDLVEKLNNNGYPASVQGKTTHGLHRVAYDHFSDKQKAITKMNELIQKGEEGLWLDRY